MPKIAKPYLMAADESPIYWQLGNLWQIMATGVQTDNSFTLLDQVVHDGGGGGPITHTHTQDEGLYIVTGQCTFNAGGHHGLIAGPGTFVAVPGDTEHSFTVDKPDTHMLNFYLPAGFEQIMMGLAHPAAERKPPPKDKIVEMLPPKWIADQLSEQYGQFADPNPFYTPPDPKKMFTKPTPGATLFPYTTHAENLESYTCFNACWTVLADTNQTGGSYCLLEARCRQGVVTPPRVYQDRDEVLYILEGEASVYIGDRVKKAKQGALAFVPSGSLYGVRIDSQEARILNLHTRSGFEKFIQLHGVRGKGDEGKAPSANFKDKTVDPGEHERLTRELGLTFAEVQPSW